jgi:hypothetical protein
LPDAKGEKNDEAVLLKNVAVIENLASGYNMHNNSGRRLVFAFSFQE